MMFLIIVNGAEAPEREAKTSRRVSGVCVKPEPSVMLLCFRETNGEGGGV